jgi:hypothetical protein
MRSRSGMHARTNLCHPHIHSRPTHEIAPMILHVLYVRLILLAACAAVAASFFDFFCSAPATVDSLDSASVQHKDSNAIRGVLESSHARYADPFLCDGRRQLPSGAVNDGFCDCVDGTDEPGACFLAVFGTRAFSAVPIPQSSVTLDSVPRVVVSHRRGPGSQEIMKLCTSNAGLRYDTKLQNFVGSGEKGDDCAFTAYPPLYGAEMASTRDCLRSSWLRVTACAPAGWCR